MSAAIDQSTPSVDAPKQKRSAGIAGKKTKKKKKTSDACVSKLMLPINPEQTISSDDRLKGAFSLLNHLDTLLRPLAVNYNPYNTSTYTASGAGGSLSAPQGSWMFRPSHQHPSPWDVHAPAGGAQLLPTSMQQDGALVSAKSKAKARKRLGAGKKKKQTSARSAAAAAAAAAAVLDTDSTASE